jgi:hypothetical protein
VLVLERTERRVLWESTSRNGGDDAASLFGTRRVKTASALACRMVKNVVAGMVDGGGAPARPVRPGAPRPASEGAHQGPERPESAQGLRRDLARIGRISPDS